ncbi:DNA-directed RNA polymerase sigma-70 factor [Haloferula helveola]|uniref:DNA-directed RNA polymerase sigma-70 factor n=2 Tax=Haloferula helveola TaxID=490095 RepID=A0ABM7RFG9_9BACT|nr:DNA-directed RNA polymerase sigma-70 factor [Haloferula helveola]
MKEAIHQFGGLVWHITRKYLRDRTAAEDTVQEIFTEIWQKAGRFEPSLSSPNTFVGMIARRRAIDCLRRQSRQPVFEPIDEAPLAAASSPSPANESVPGDPDAAMNALKELPDETRNLFELHFRLGLTHGEIAEKTGLPLGTVKTRLRRGLIALRDRMSARTPTIEPAS